MTPEQQRIAIAEACGWIRAYEEGDDEGCGKWFWHKGRKNLKQPPDYLNDLNAMHEAEKRLDYEQCEAFSTTLADIVHAANREKDYAFPWAFARIHATAGQRAEAFLRTLGLWTTTPTQPQ